MPDYGTHWDKVDKIDSIVDVLRKNQAHDRWLGIIAIIIAGIALDVAIIEVVR